MSAASYPNFAGKHAEEAIFTPADFAAYLRRVGALESYQPPAGVVLCYQRSLYNYVLQAERLKSPERRGALHGLLPLPSTGGRVGLLGQFGIGAPAAAAALEELAAMGTPAFVSVGTAGSLQRNLDIGDLVLCEAAIRDEGVSHHYLPPAKLATAAAAMSTAVGAAMSQARCSVPGRGFLDDRHSLPGNGRRGPPLPGGRSAVRGNGSRRTVRGGQGPGPASRLGLHHQRLPGRPGLESSIPRTTGPGLRHHAVRGGSERPASP